MLFCGFNSALVDSAPATSLPQWSSLPSHRSRLPLVSPSPHLSLLCLPSNFHLLLCIVELVCGVWRNLEGHYSVSNPPSLNLIPPFHLLNSPEQEESFPQKSTRSSWLSMNSISHHYCFNCESVSPSSSSSLCIRCCA